MKKRISEIQVRQSRNDNTFKYNSIKQKNMKITWIFEEDGPGLREYVENFIDIKPYSGHLPDIYEPVIFYGTIRVIQHLQKTIQGFKYIPGAYFRFKEVDFSSFAGAFGYFLLNSDYIMLPAGDLRGRWLYWCSRFDMGGGNYKLFVRPNSSLKSFAGGIISEKEFNECNVEDDKIVVIAEPEKILREWRLVVVDNKIVAGGQYAEGGSYGECYHTSSCPEYVLKPSQMMIDSVKYSPDKVWVLDVCEVRGGWIKVVECNCFSTSGLYKIDMSKAVKEIERVAIEEWREYVS